MWMGGVFVGKLDRTDEFLLLTPTGATKTRCVKRLEDNARDLPFLNLCVGNPWNATARTTQQKPTIQQKDELESGRRAKIMYLRQNILDNYGPTAGCPGCVGNGQQTEEYQARIEQDMVDKGDAIKLGTSGNQEEIAQEPDVSLKKRKIGEPDINPGGTSSFTADTPKRRESEQGSSAGDGNLLAGCIAAINKLLCDTPSVDLSRGRTALSGKFPEDELKAGRDLELLNMLPPGKHAHDMVWVDEWRGDRVRSRLCVRQFKAEVLRDDLFAGTPDRFSSSICWPKLRVARILDHSSLTSMLHFMHARIDEEMYVKVPSGIKRSRFGRLKAAVNGTRKASKHWQEFSCDQLVTNMFSNR